MVVAAAVYDRRLRSIVGSAPTRARREEGHMKTFGNLILMTAICVIIFVAFMTLRPAQAGSPHWFDCGKNGEYLLFVQSITGKGYYQISISRSK
jgi:hypothetical protein